MMSKYVKGKKFESAVDFYADKDHWDGNKMRLVYDVDTLLKCGGMARQRQKERNQEVKGEH